MGEEDIVYPMCMSLNLSSKGGWWELLFSNLQVEV